MAKSVFSMPIGYRAATEDERCNSVVPEHVAFYTIVIERGIGLPLHPFYFDILDFYNLAPAQLLYIPWFHMLGTLHLYCKENLGVPTVTEWHNFYCLQEAAEGEGLYYFTKWAGGEPPLITNLPSSIGEWKTKYFWLHEDLDGRN